MSYNPYLFLLPIFILALIYKNFLKKGGIILRMDGFLPKKKGIREKDNKWAPLVSNIGILATILVCIYTWILFIQTETAKIPAFN